MTFKRSLIRTLIFTLVVITFFTACSKEDDEPINSYLVSDELVFTYSISSINNMIDMASIQDHRISSFKQYVKSDVKVFRIVYRTKINGKSINASGLVCVPVNKGEYPVLSFQNGTNTLNSQAPSVYPMNSSYVLVEILASMGFVVVIPDYPGFGESVSIPHPYLIKEPTVTSIADMFYATDEFDDTKLPDINILNDYYLIGYSQGGWATLALHKALELEYNKDFNLAGSVCAAGPYDIGLLFSNMVDAASYSMPVYIGYIFNAYSVYNQITNPVTDIFNEPYASRIGTLYNGTKSFEQINSQLSASIPELLNSKFISEYKISDKYSSVRNAFKTNSVGSWHTYKSILFIHGGSDTEVNPITTENIYNEMIQAGSSSEIIRKVIIPEADHSDGVLPAMIEGIEFLYNLKDNR